MLKQVFSKKVHGRLLKTVKRQGQTGWLEPAGGGERILVFGDKATDVFYEPEAFAKIMVDVHGAREERKRAERIQRKLDQGPMDRLLRGAKPPIPSGLIPYGA